MVADRRASCRRRWASVNCWPAGVLATGHLAVEERGQVRQGVTLGGQRLPLLDLLLGHTRHPLPQRLGRDAEHLDELAEGVEGDFAPRIAEPPNPTLSRATLNIVGPIQAKKNIAVGRRNVADTTLTRLAGTVTRQVLDGGRQTLLGSVAVDRRAKGWRRITDGHPCSFCATIAGAVVTDAKRDFRAHDHCGCSAEPNFV